MKDSKLNTSIEFIKGIGKIRAKILKDELGNLKTHKKSMHTIDMVKRNSIHLDIDHLQMGVGGEDSWGARPLEQYQLLPKHYIYHFSLRVIEPNDDPINIYKNSFH